VAAWRADLAALGPQLVGSLRAHIEKENEILYPMALAHLEPSSFDAMREAADRIGPCSFS
jgi:hemerythrin-like domain-containing protein